MAMRNVLIYGDINSSDYGVYIGQKTVHNVPERAVEVVSVPGRNGALTIDKGHYENVPIEYYCFVDGETEEEMHENYNAFKNAIASVVGYRKLIDTYYPDEYRMALFIEGIDAESVALGKGIEFILSFNCMPQRYLTVGDTPVTVTNNSVLNNPTLFDAEPLLMVEGYGNVSFNGYNVEIENASMGQITLWANGNVSSVSQDELTATKNIDTSPFNNGDEFTFDLAVQALYSTTSGVTSKSHSGNGTDTITIRESSITILDMLEITHAIGTASVVTDTLTVMSGANLTIEITLTTSYDGDSTVTLSANTSRWQRRQNVILMWSDCVGDSSLLILGHPTYIDCEVGEAYKYENGNLIGLNAYIDLGSDLPKLASGNNTFTIDNTITSLQVVPKWWQL